ncbi:MAG: hypothetical protein IRD7MM_02795 [Candidatus Midichloria mitochondrii]|nr:hypothetical protein [Candidatus Midichloria mitochondrii]MDJ1288570.1 hypothetical protein [Candidatus Midichloria mitochondrii]MDJ1313421.1 hypothetical protein [Candidatus Midichloria mitochondrii]
MVIKCAQDQITELASRQGALISQILLYNLPCSNKIFQEKRQPFSAIEGAFTDNNRVVIRREGPGRLFGKSQLAKFLVIDACGE